MTNSAGNKSVEENLLHPPSEKSFQGEAVRRPDISQRRQLAIKVVIFLACIGVLIAGQQGVPDNEVPCIVDKVQEWLYGFNAFILTHTAWRDGLQITCSAFMDILFLSTFIYWVVFGKSSRLIITMFIFYGVRFLIQKVWFSPFPAGFTWYYPGFPSLVVPYGRGSDFFYSGHIGFVTICFCEWRINKKFWMQLFVFTGGLYTLFILLAYQVHYIIDIFTGIIFAHWAFWMVDYYKGNIDGFFHSIYSHVINVFKPKSSKEAELV